MIVCAIIATLAGIAVPAYIRLMDRSRINKTIVDIKTLETQITEFEFACARLPASLDEINRAGLKDPWGNNYVYMKFDDEGTKGQKVRKDRSLHPLNSTYDLCSMGKDGESAAPLTAQVSHDDIIRANDGGYIGLASGY